VKGKAVVRREIAMPKIRCLNKLRADIFPPCGKSVGVFVRLDNTEHFQTCIIEPVLSQDIL